MSDNAPQTYANHARYYFVYHFIVVPLLVINLIVRIVYAVRHREEGLSWWEIVIAVSLLLLAWTARVMPLTVQNRIIRLEEQLRLQRCLPEHLRSRIGELRTSQLIALRFAPDDEVVALAEAILSGEVKTNDEVKRRVKNWRADYLRA